MKHLLFTSLLLCSGLAHAQELTSDLIFSTSIGPEHYVMSQGSDNLTVTAAGGLNLIAGSSVQIQAGTDSPLSLSTTSGNDIDVNAGGNLVVFPGAGYTTQLVDGVQLYQLSAQPICNDSRRGMITYVSGGAGTADHVQACMKADDDSYAWVNVK